MRQELKKPEVRQAYEEETKVLSNGPIRPLSTEEPFEKAAFAGAGSIVVCVPARRAGKPLGVELQRRVLP